MSRTGVKFTVILLYSIIDDYSNTSINFLVYDESLNTSFLYIAYKDLLFIRANPTLPSTVWAYLSSIMCLFLLGVTISLAIVLLWRIDSSMSLSKIKIIRKFLLVVRIYQKYFSETWYLVYTKISFLHSFLNPIYIEVIHRRQF